MNTLQRSTSLIALGLLVSMSVAAETQKCPVCQPRGEIQIFSDLEGGEQASAFSVSDDGNVVSITSQDGWHYQSDGRPYVWIRGRGLIELPFPHSDEHHENEGRPVAEAYQVSGNGKYILGRSGVEDSDGAEKIRTLKLRWSVDQLRAEVIGICDEDIPLGICGGMMTSDGSKVLGAYRAYGPPDFNRFSNWEEGKGLSLLKSNLPSNRSVSGIKSISDSGRMLAGIALDNEAGIRHSALIDLDGHTEMLDDQYGEATRISRDGRTVLVGGYIGDKHLGFLRNNCQFEPIELMGQVWTSSYDFGYLVSAVDTSTEHLHDTAFYVWSSKTHTSVNLNQALADRYHIDLGGRRIYKIFGISADGRTFVGMIEKQNPDPYGGPRDAFILTLDRPVDAL